MTELERTKAVLCQFDWNETAFVYILISVI